MYATLHARTKSELDKAFEHLESIGYRSSCCPTLPGKAVITWGVRTPIQYYSRYSWHESISASKEARKIYTTSREHPLMWQQSEGLCWATHMFVDGAVEGIHLNGDKIDAVHIVDNVGESHYCTEFKIYAPHMSVESDRWWRIKDPFISEERVYFFGYSNENPQLAIVEKCEFYEDLEFSGCWRIKAHIVGTNRQVSAGSWMFSRNLKRGNKKGECFQVNQWYCDYPENLGYSTACSSENSPCYNNEEEACKFLDAAAFPGDVTRIVTINGLKTGWTNGVVYKKKDGERNYQVAREQSSQIIEKAKNSKNLVRSLQSRSLRLSQDKFDYFA